MQDHFQVLILEEDGQLWAVTTSSSLEAALAEALSWWERNVLQYPRPNRPAPTLFIATPGLQPRRLAYVVPGPATMKVVG